MAGETKGIHAVLIPGDGIGPEISEAVVKIFDSAGANVEWEEINIGEAVIQQEGTPLPETALQRIREKRLALKGPVTTPVGGGFRSVNVGLRKALDLYANVRPVRSIPGVNSRFEDVDLVFVRENTEGLYSGLEHEVTPGVVTSLKVATSNACLRIAEFAFKYARRTGRKKITAIHKANILKLSDGLALTCYREISKEYPEIDYDERIVDATCMSLVMDPNQFDVLLMENLYGDILSDLGAGLIGGLGLAPGGNIGDKAAVFEAVHGSAPDIAGQGVANPTALLLSAIEMLRYTGHSESADRISTALFAVLSEGKRVTRDLGGKAGTMEFAQAVVDSLK